MTDLQFAEEILLQLQEKNPRFHGKAYLSSCQRSIT